jgi:hypothetical protein
VECDGVGEEDQERRATTTTWSPVEDWQAAAC